MLAYDTAEAEEQWEAYVQVRAALPCILGQGFLPIHTVLLQECEIYDGVICTSIQGACTYVHRNGW